MQKLIILFSAILLHTHLAVAQYDPEAQKILDALAKKVKTYSSIKMNFTLVIENHQNGETQKHKGDILFKNEKYRMNLKKNIVYFDGKNVYNYLPESKEVTISRPNKKDEDLFYQNPVQLFTLYTKNFKYRLLGQTSFNKHNCYEVDLYPVDIDKKYSIIKLLIDTNDNMLVAAKMIMKSGIHYIIYIDTFNPDVKASDSDFTFDTKANKDVEIIDLRK